MTRLSRQIYATIIICLLLVVLVAGSIWRFGVANPLAEQALHIVGEMAAASLPSSETPAETQAAGLRQLAKRLKLDISLFGSDRMLIAAAGSQTPPPPEGGTSRGWERGAEGLVFHARLPDARWIGVRLSRPVRHPAVGLVLVLAIVSLIVAICAYPVVRWITRRLEKLQLAVEELGSGGTGVRVDVKGKDEVARLAASFNQAAEQIEALLASHRQLLAYTSHELRTPLSRVRLGVEFLKKSPNAARLEALERDLAELDELIEEILVAARLEADDVSLATAEVDLLALAAEECAHYRDCELSGSAALVQGDERLLRRLMRNLLDNAERHGKPPVSVQVGESGDFATLRVRDEGEGIPAEIQDSVFEPFYRKPGPERSAGFGLGLALVKRIARLHGGDAAIVATDAGCEVYITLRYGEMRETGSS